jgi:hypothetical protein
MRVGADTLGVTRKVDRLADKLALAELQPEETVFLAGCTLAVSPGKKDNWIEAVGGELPEYICEIGRAVMRSGHSRSNAIQIAVGTVKRWAKGVGNVNADTRAKAAAAVVQWEALKAKAHIKDAVS